MQSAGPARRPRPPASPASDRAVRPGPGGAGLPHASAMIGGPFAPDPAGAPAGAPHRPQPAAAEQIAVGPADGDDGVGAMTRRDRLRPGGGGGRWESTRRRPDLSNRRTAIASGQA